MYLLDTDIVIFSLKGVERVVSAFHDHRHCSMAVSAVTYGELVYGAEASARREENLAYVYRVAELYPVLPVTRAIMDSFGRLKSDLRRVGMPLDEFDLLIACTALTHGLTLVTNNTRHFDRVPGLRLANWAGG